VRVALHDLSTEECLEQLASGKIDVALTVRPCPSQGRGLVFEKLASHSTRCAVSVTHPLARQRSVSLAQLKGERFIIYSRKDYPEYYEMLKHTFRPYGFEPRIGEEYDGVTGLIAAVEAGQGVALVTESLACLGGLRLKLLKIKPELTPVVMGAVMPREASEFARAFVEAARKAAKLG
jgi:DNA-binding transcriptional LysR family regulator